MKSFIAGIAIGQLIILATQAYVINSKGVVNNIFIGTYQVTERK